MSELFLREIIREAILKRSINSVNPATGERSSIPFWKGCWMVQRAQEEGEWDRRQHDTQHAWERWTRLKAGTRL